MSAPTRLEAERDLAADRAERFPHEPPSSPEDEEELPIDPERTASWPGTPGACSSTHPPDPERTAA